MILKIQCPNCSKRFRTDEHNLGRDTVCPACAHRFVIEKAIGKENRENSRLSPEVTNSLNLENDNGAKEFEESFASFSNQNSSNSKSHQHQSSTDWNFSSPRQSSLARRLLLGITIGVAGGVSLAISGYFLFFATYHSGKAQRAAERQELKHNPIREEFQGVVGWSDGETMWTEFRGKKIPKDHALVLGLLHSEKPVEVYEDPKSLPFEYVIRDREAGFVFTEAWEDAKYQQARRDGWISDLQPMLLVRVIEKIHGDQFSFKYWYKDSGIIADTLVKVQVAEGPRLGETWWVRDIDLVEFAQSIEDSGGEQKIR